MLLSVWKINAPVMFCELELDCYLSVSIGFYIGPDDNLVHSAHVLCFTVCWFWLFHSQQCVAGVVNYSTYNVCYYDHRYAYCIMYICMYDEWCIDVCFMKCKSNGQCSGDGVNPMSPFPKEGELFMDWLFYEFMFL